MFGRRLSDAFEQVKDDFDPAGLLNPGKIVRPGRMDDRNLFRYAPGYAHLPVDCGLDWSAWGGFGRAVEMCNNNGACRKAGAGVICPSYRASGDEMHLTRGRANALRLALSGQLGADALVSDEMVAAMDLCLGCKACRRECPTGVDMTRMKTEVLYQRHKRRGLGLQERLIAYLPRYAPVAARLAPLLNLRDRVPGLAAASQYLLGLDARRRLPGWRRDHFDGADGTAGGTDVVLFADTFDTYFEPENLRAARAVLGAAGYRVRVAAPADGGRRLCCGRTFLAAGLIDEARVEAGRVLAALAPYVAAGTPVVGLEPSCLLTLRDEFTVLVPGAEALAGRAFLFEEFIAAEARAGRLALDLVSAGGRRALVHGHCHQKAFGAMGDVEACLRLVPELDVEVIEAGCCGMAGAFGYQAGHFEMSMRIGEMGPLPRVRAADPADHIVAPGTSCRHQIEAGAGRRAVHPARLLRDYLAEK
jgi:Fe-S oxidoreductase